MVIMEKYSDSIEARLTARHKKCIQLCGSVKGKVILDIGCSFGWFEKFAVENGCKEIVAIDLDEKSLLSAKRQVNTRQVKFLKASTLNLSQFRNGYFDMVVMFDTIEHLPKNTERKCLLEIKRVLKKNDELIISTPNSSFFSNLSDPTWYFGHRHYSSGNITKLLCESGFEIKEISYGGGFYEQFSMILLYIFKWLFMREIPFKKWFEKRRETEYFNSRKFVTLFIKAKNSGKNV